MPPRRAGGQPLSSHLCALDVAVTELRAKGAEIAVGAVMRNPGLYLAFVRGPEGVMVELVQR